MTKSIVVSEEDVEAADLLTVLNTELGVRSNPAILALARARSIGADDQAQRTPSGASGLASVEHEAWSSAADVTVKSQRLLALYLAGDVEAAGRLVTLTTPVLWQVARTQGLDPLSAEEVIERVWMTWVVEAEAIADQPLVNWLIIRTANEAKKASVRTLSAETDSEKVSAALSRTLKKLLTSAAEPVST